MEIPAFGLGQIVNVLFLHQIVYDHSFSHEKIITSMHAKGEGETVQKEGGRGRPWSS
jgi:hypothetical protein